MDIQHIWQLLHQALSDPALQGVGILISILGSAIKKNDNHVMKAYNNLIESGLRIQSDKIVLKLIEQGSYSQTYQFTYYYYYHHHPLASSQHDFGHSYYLLSIAKFQCTIIP